MKQLNSTTTNNYAYIDRLRVLASMAVILIHVTLGSLETLTPFGLLWWTGHWICLINQWAVPIFVMISGALLLNPEHHVDSPIHFYKKRFQKLGWPLLFWTTVYFAIRRFLDHEPVTAGYILDHLAQADPPYHTYFLFLMVGLYLVTPVLRTLVQNTSSSQRQGLIMILFTLSSGYALANAWFWGNGRFLLSFFVPYVG
jgi:surface polysaccharide O-acyltransferase-like enzyme